ncbi:hypothetical protein IEQ34_014187 [Dendrobium chrysotoxum]|uniref:FAD-binding domain-containing protein n=1 Tax=Dendrobium chrysotoxum TaxID=161865 RepID=A0AAV7GJ90_DENCH|nr:hypothetical protein IEQ34_014187 [Dendrobium chrysotoxum]
MEKIEEVVIVGAGVSGLGTALGLHRKGIRSLVLESSDSLRAAGFAILTWPNAWKALDVLGVGDFLRENHVLLQRLVINSATTGEAIAERTFSRGEQRLKLEVRSLKRNLLLEALSKDLPPETIRFSSKVVYIEEVGKLKLLHLADGSTLKTKVLIGCDGVNSVVAKWLGLKPLLFSGRSASRGMLNAPQFSISSRRLIEYFFGEGFRAGISHCDEDTIYWFFTWSPSNQAEKEAEENPQKMRELMVSKLKSSKMPKDVIEIIENSDLSNGLVSAPLRFRWPFDLLWGNIFKDNVCVAGDAFHPMTPDLGQGGCSALEDAVVLARCLGEALAGDGNKTEEKEFEKVEKGLKKYAEVRKWRSFVLISASYLIGQLEERNGFLIRFLREKLLSGFISWIQLKITEFDCGSL